MKTENTKQKPAVFQSRLHDARPAILQKLSASRHEIFFLLLESDGVSYEERALPEKARAVKWQGGLGRADTLEARLALMPAFEAVLESVKPDLVQSFFAPRICTLVAH